jgi:hypothetical protein
MVDQHTQWNHHTAGYESRSTCLITAGNRRLVLTFSYREDILLKTESLQHQPWSGRYVSTVHLLLPVKTVSFWFVSYSVLSRCADYRSYIARMKYGRMRGVRVSRTWPDLRKYVFALPSVHDSSWILLEWYVAASNVHGYCSTYGTFFIKIYRFSIQILRNCENSILLGCDAV